MYPGLRWVELDALQRGCSPYSSMLRWLELSAACVTFGLLYMPLAVQE